MDIANTTLKKVRRASILRILKDLAETRPELFEDCIVAGLQAPPPRSAPYLLAALAYLDGKPLDGEPQPQPIVDLSSLTMEDLRRRALRIAGAVPANTALAVIDAQVIPNPEPTMEELEEDVRIAQLELQQANAELDRLNAILRDLRNGSRQ